MPQRQHISTTEAPQRPQRGPTWPPNKHLTNPKQTRKARGRPHAPISVSVISYSNVFSDENSRLRHTPYPLMVGKWQRDRDGHPTHPFHSGNPDTHQPTHHLSIRFQNGKRVGETVDPCPFLPDKGKQRECHMILHCVGSGRASPFWKEGDKVSQ